MKNKSCNQTMPRAHINKRSGTMATTITSSISEATKPENRLIDHTRTTPQFDVCQNQSLVPDPSTIAYSNRATPKMEPPRGCKNLKMETKAPRQITNPKNCLFITVNDDISRGQFQTHSSQNGTLEFQPIYKETELSSDVPTEVITSNLKFPTGEQQSSKSVIGPLASRCCPVQRSGHQEGTVLPVPPRDFLTAPELEGAARDRRVEKAKIEDEARHFRSGGRKTVKRSGILNRGGEALLVLPITKKRRKGKKKKKRETEKVTPIMILKSGFKCHLFKDATPTENWDAGEKEKWRKKKRKGEGAMMLRSGVKKWGEVLTQNRRRGKKLEPTATNSRDPILREVTFIIIPSCHQQKQYQQFREKWRKQPKAPGLSLAVVVLIKLLSAARKWLQLRKGLYQPKGSFNVGSMNSCSVPYPIPYRISFLIASSLKSVFILPLIKLSSSLSLWLLLAALVSVRHQRIQKHKAEYNTNIKNHVFVLLRKRRGASNDRDRVRTTDFLSVSHSVIKRTRSGVIQQIRPQEHYSKLNYLGIDSDLVNTNCDDKKNNSDNYGNNRPKDCGHDCNSNHSSECLSRVAKKQPTCETVSFPISIIKPSVAPPKEPYLKIREGDENGKGSDEVCHNNRKTKRETFSSARISINVPTCSVSESTHTHSHRRDRNYETFKHGQNYPHPNNQILKCNVSLNNSPNKIIIRRLPDGIILRIGGWVTLFKSYAKKVALYSNHYDNYVSENIAVYNSSPFAPFGLDLHRSGNALVITVEKDELYRFVPFPIYEDIGWLLTKVRLFHDDNCLFFRPGLGWEVDDRNSDTELALCEEDERRNISRMRKNYYEIQKTSRTPGNKVSHSNQKRKREDESEATREEGEKRNTIVLLSQRTRNRRIYPADEIGTPFGADEKLNPTSRLALLATTRLAYNTKLLDGATNTTATREEREMKPANTTSFGACGSQQKGRMRMESKSERRLLVIASSSEKGCSSSRGRGCQTMNRRNNPTSDSEKYRRGSNLVGVDLVPQSVLPELGESQKGSQSIVDAKNGPFEKHHKGSRSSTLPPEWTTQSTIQHTPTRMETTSPGILTQFSAVTNQPPNHLTRDSDNTHIIPHSSTTYTSDSTNDYSDSTNTSSSEPLNVTNEDTERGFDKYTRNTISLSRVENNGPSKRMAMRRLPESHQSKFSVKNPENNNSSTPPSTSLFSQLSPSCFKNPSSRHYTPNCSQTPLSLHHHQHNNHHQKQQQQNSPTQHNNNNNKNNYINISYYYDYYCDYFNKFAKRFSAKNLNRMVPVWGKTFLSVILIFQLVGTSMLTSAGPVPKKKLRNEDKGLKYLMDFGYVSGPSQEAENLMSGSVKVESIKRFQSFADLPITGIFDHRTMEMMEKPRCGNSDKQALMEGDGTGRTKRYILSDSQWKRTNLTFRFLNYTPDIDFPKIRKAIYDAFRVWSRVTHLTFTEIMFDSNNGKDADIRIQFAQRYHNDGYPFDGEGIILAHAFFPGENKGGDTHFDDDEHWTVDSDEGVNLFMVAAHEFGHALGLSHSKTPGSLMYPWYQGKQSKGYQLPPDDVAGIQRLYGVKKGNESIDILVKEFPDVDDNTPSNDYDDEIPHGNCTHTFDAITRIRGDVYIFKGKYFWRWTSGGLKDATPIPISHFWYQYPEDSIDAVFERERDSKIMFFKGDKYWLYDANHMERGWPLKGRPLVELGLPGDLKKIDAAFTWGFNQRTYLVSNDMYWKFDKEQSFMVYDYPRAMSIWEGVPTPLDAAFRFTDNKTYFIKGKHYWEYVDQKMRVKSDAPSGNIAERWMQCPSEPKRRPQQVNKLPMNAGSKRKSEVSGLLIWTLGYISKRLLA